MVMHEKERARRAELAREREQERLEARYTDEELRALAGNGEVEEPPHWEP